MLYNIFLEVREGFDKRHVILSDSMTAACAFSRGRAHTWELRRVCQQFGALCLATGAQVTVRWIPSEWNPSDCPSRGGWKPSAPKRNLADGAVQEPFAVQPLGVVLPKEANKKSVEKEACPHGAICATSGFLAGSEDGHRAGVFADDKRQPKDGAKGLAGEEGMGREWKDHSATTDTRGIGIK